MSEIAEYTEKIELLLNEQQKENEKLKKVQIIQSSMLLFFVIVFAVGMMVLNFNVKKATQGIPELVATTTASVETTSEEIKVLLEEVNAVDFKGINKTVKDAGDSINKLDIESLNSSIQSLNQVVKKLADLFGM